MNISSSAALRAKGDTRRPLYALMAGSALNVALNYVAVSLGTGVVGIAVATVISNAVAAGFLVWVLMHEEGVFRLDPRSLCLEPAAVRSIIRIGVPSGVQSMVFSLSNVVIQSTVNSFGTDAIAGNACEVNFEAYSYYFINAFSQASVTFVGQNFAARKCERCDKAVRLCLAMGAATSFVFVMTVTLLGDTALGIFTTDAAALEFARTRVWHALAIHWLMVFIEIPASAIRGMGWATLPTIVTIFGTCILRLMYVFWLFPVWGTYEALVLIYPASWVLTGTAMLALFFHVRKQVYPTLRAAA